jgi:hypothetical protein
VYRRRGRHVAHGFVAIGTTPPDFLPPFDPGGDGTVTVNRPPDPGSRYGGTLYVPVAGFAELVVGRRPDVSPSATRSGASDRLPAQSVFTFRARRRRRRRPRSWTWPGDVEDFPPSATWGRSTLASGDSVPAPGVRRLTRSSDAASTVAAPSRDTITIDEKLAVLVDLVPVVDPHAASAVRRF